MTLRPALHLALGACALMAGSIACHETDVVVAKAGQPVDGGPNQGCSSNDECLPFEYCSKTSCDDAQGTCWARPDSCDDAFAPECGCDGVVYWNDCLRERDGVGAVSSQGQCTGGQPFTVCGGPTNGQCPVADAYCNQLAVGGPRRCELAPEGVCWVLPDTCPTDAGVPSLHKCGQGPPACVDLCTAIQSGEAYQAGGPPCP
jgi:hypothetical protein